MTTLRGSQIAKKPPKKRSKPKSVTTEKNGQDSKGRFTKGNKLAKGNPAALRTQRYRDMFDESVTESEWKAVVKAIIKKAKGGDMQAGKLILEYGMGKPKQTHTIDTTTPEEHAEGIRDHLAVMDS